MKRKNYMNILNEMLGDELYFKFLMEISKGYEGTNLVKFGEELVNNFGELIIQLGKTKGLNVETVKLCFDDRVVEINYKEFAKKLIMYKNI